MHEKYRLWVVLVIAISFMIPSYIYMTGSYEETTASIVPTSVTLVDNDKFTMSNPIMITDSYDDGHTYSVPSVWGDYIVYEEYDGVDVNFITGYQISTGEEFSVAYNTSNEYYNPEIYENIVVYNNVTSMNYDAMIFWNMTTNVTWVVDDTDVGTWYSLPKIWGDYVVFENYTGASFDNITYSYLNGTSQVNVPLSEGYSPNFPDISNDTIVYRVSTVGIANVTTYDIVEDETNTIFSVTTGILGTFSIWDDQISWYYAYAGNYSIWFHDMELNMTSRVDWGIKENGQDRQSTLPAVCEDLVVYGEWNTTWGIVIWDSETNSTFAIDDLTLSYIYPDAYFDGEDYIVTWVNYNGSYVDIMMAFINSTADGQDGDGLSPDIQSHTLYDLNTIYVAIISTIVGICFSLIYINYYVEVN